MNRMERDKERILEELCQIPIIQVVMKRSKVSRATYYRWRAEDPKFREQADLALQEGRTFISEVAESQLINNIKSGNNTAIIYWLKHNEERYKEKSPAKAESAVIFRSRTDEELVDLIVAAITGLDRAQGSNLMKQISEKVSVNKE